MSNGTEHTSRHREFLTALGGEARAAVGTAFSINSKHDEVVLIFQPPVWHLPLGQVVRWQIIDQAAIEPIEIARLVVSDLMAEVERRRERDRRLDDQDLA